MKENNIIVLGAGPAGLGAALELQRQGEKNIIIIERHEKAGGLSRTLNFKNHLFDIGPHRFFTKNKEVYQFWKDTLRKEFKPVSRLTRIYYKHKYFSYPLKPFNALRKLGIKDSIAAVMSYLAAIVTPHKKQARSFEEWVSRQFGKKLYSIFFKTYTEKVWGIECASISADWAAQRIKGLNLLKAVADAFNPFKSTKQTKTLVEEFDYPVKGAGMMYETMAAAFEKAGGRIMYNTEVTGINRGNDSVTSVTVTRNGKYEEIEAVAVFSSIPLTQTVKMIKPAPEPAVLDAAKELFYRDHITVNLIIKGEKLFPDQWIYVHSPDVKMGRLANYSNFSSDMSPDNTTTPISVEYFTFKHDELWSMSEEKLVQLALDELEYMGLVDKTKYVDGQVVRETESYPIYFIGYEVFFDKLKTFVSTIRNFYCIGRAGMYKYNNQDHSLYTGMLAARSYCGEFYDVWQVNIDAEYQEETRRDELATS